MERHIGRYCAAIPSAKAQQYHWIAAMMSSAEAPIIWSITNGSELMKNVPPPIAAAAINEMHITTKAGIVQSNCSMTKRYQDEVNMQLLIESFQQ